MQTFGHHLLIYFALVKYVEYIWILANVFRGLVLHALINWIQNNRYAALLMHKSSSIGCGYSIIAYKMKVFTKNSSKHLWISLNVLPLFVQRKRDASNTLNSFGLHFFWKKRIKVFFSQYSCFYIEVSFWNIWHIFWSAISSNWFHFKCLMIEKYRNQLIGFD